MTMDEVEVGIREVKWSLRILRDQVLRIAEVLPVTDRERIVEISERMTAVAQDLSAAIDCKRTESAAKARARLRDDITAVQQQLALIANELIEVALGLPE